MSVTVQNPETVSAGGVALKVIRRLALAGVLLTLIAGLAFVGAFVYVASGSANPRIAARLRAALGMPVHVRSAAMGLSAFSLGEVTVFPPTEEPRAVPWLTVGSLSADLSCWQVLRGEASPGRVDLTDVAVTLDFDRQGRLLTTIPTPSADAGQGLPECRFARTTVTLRREGVPPLVFSGVQARLTSENGQTTLTLQSPAVHVDRELLERLPFVPAQTWRQVVVAEGETTVELTLRFPRADAPGSRIGYRIVLEPRDAAVEITGIKLHATRTSGTVIVEDGRVQLRDVCGETAEGKMRTEADMDFRGDVYQLNFGKIDLQGIELQKLPQTWKLPMFVTGRLDGTAHLLVRVLAEGKLSTTGAGEGVVVGAARVMGFGLPLAPIRLTMTASDKGFQFQPLGKPQSRQPDPAAAVALATLLVAPPEPPPSPSPSSWLVDGLSAGVLDAGQAAAKAAGFVANAVKPHTIDGPAPRPAAPATTYLDADLGLRDVDLAQLLEGLKLPLPIPVRGRGSFQVRVGIPFGNTGDLKAYRLTGTAHLSWVKIADLELEGVDASVAYRDGMLRLEKLTGVVSGGRPPERSLEPAGTFGGEVRVQVAPPGDLSGRLDVQHLPVGKLLRPFPELQDAAGELSGNVRVRAPLERLTDPIAWDLTGRFTGDHITAAGWTVTGADAELRAAGGELTLSRFSARLEGAPLSGTGRLKLTAPHAYSAKLTMVPPKDESRKLPIPLPAGIEVAGRFGLDADLSGTLTPLTWKASGDGTADVLEVSGLRFDGLKVKWDANAERVRLTDLRVKYDHGELTGTGKIPLQAAIDGDVHLKFDGLGVTALSKEAKGIPFRVDGTVSGSLETTIPAAGEQGARNVTSHLEMTSPQLRVRGIPTQKLKGDIDYRDGEVEYKLEGSVLGGKFDLNGKVPATGGKGDGGKRGAGEKNRRQREEIVPAILLEAEPAEPQGPGLPGEGRLRLEGVRLSLLGEALQQETLLPLAGRVDLDVRFAAGPDGVSVGGGSVRLRNFSYAAAVLAADLQADVALRGSRVSLNNFAGLVAGGTLGARAMYDWARPGRSWFTVNAQQVEAARLFAPFPELAARVTGPLELRIRGTIGREVDGSGDVLLSRGAVGGVEVVDWRLPIHFAFHPWSGRGQLEIRDSSARVGSGRVTGQVTSTWGVVRRLEGQVRFLNADLNALLRPAGSLNGYAAGRATGRFDFGGNGVQSVDDLTGLLDASFQQTQAQALPVLPQLLPFLLPGGSASTTFQSGDVRARLAGGVWRIERLRLLGSLLQMFVEGRATTQGRLDLQVTASTNLLGLASPVLRTIGVRMSSSPSPGLLLAEARNLLTARLASLRVTGTVASPNIRFEPLQTLPEEAIRFFLGIVTAPSSLGGP